MQIKSFTKFITFIALVVAILLQTSITSSPINYTAERVVISVSEIEDLSSDFPVNYKIEKQSNKAFIKIKLFDFFTFKTVEADIVENELVYLGGDAIGVNISGDGVIVIGKTDIVTEDGLRSPTKNANIATGDIILAINDTKVNNQRDINNFFKTYTDGDLKLTIRRGANLYETVVTPYLDTLSNEYKLGLFIRDEISGIGTLTFIHKDDYRYGAIGHNISESLIPKDSEISGDIYRCTINSVIKGVRNQAGELQGSYVPINSMGDIEICNNYGLYGNSIESFTQGRQEIEVANRYSAKVGKAEIWTTISGDKPEKFEVEIVKLNYQKTDAEKGMVIRVTDKRLLENTGGIVQGMSGSPIVQNGKLIGAVTHVFLSDPTKGYGIYIDWMKDS